MLLYDDDLRVAHDMKECFYDICQDTKYSYLRMAFWEWVKTTEKSGIPNSRVVQKHIETGPKVY